MPWQTTHAQRVYPWKFSTGVRTLSSAIGRNLHETIIDYRERREENSSAIKSPRKTSRRGNGRKGRVITGPNPSWAPEITTSTHLARRSGLYTPSQSLAIFSLAPLRFNFAEKISHSATSELNDPHDSWENHFEILYRWLGIKMLPCRGKFM